MTQTIAAAPVDRGGTEVTGREGDPWPDRNRVLLAVVAAATVVPYFWAAVRDARNGFYPTLDVAATITRSRATFSPHPPLYGMWSSGSSWAGHEIHFPGPILLYLLAAPVHLLGNTWGTLLGMAVINSAFVLMTGWVVYRRLGVHAALLTFLLLNVFAWSLGSENLVDARPMEMVTIPFLCFLILVWLVASGEIDALPALAITANYLFLNHLVMSLQIPLIGLCAVAGVVIWVRRARARDPNLTPGRYRPLRRRLLQAGAITLVMWVPSLVQQIRNDPGNLYLLIKASGEPRNPVGSYVEAYNIVIRLLAQPTFWFRGRFDEADLPRGLSTLGVLDVVSGVVLAGIFVALGLVAWKRRDRMSLGALGVAFVAIVVSIETVTQAPGGWGFPMQYLRSLWGLAAFVWFALAFAAYRALREHLAIRVASIAGVAAVVFAVLGLSFANYGAATDMERVHLARQMVDEVVPQLVGRGDIDVTTGPNFESQRYFASLLLALSTEGVHFCVGPYAAQQYGHQHDCRSDDHVSVHVMAPLKGEPTSLKVLADIHLLSKAEAAEFPRVRAEFTDWLAGKDRIRLTEKAQRLVAAEGAAWERHVAELLAPADGDLTDLVHSDEFQLLMEMEHGFGRSDAAEPIFVAEDDIPIEAIARYYELSPERRGTLRVVERDRS